MADDDFDPNDETMGDAAGASGGDDPASLVVEVAGSEIVEVPAILPVLPVRDVVVYPGVTMPLAIGRPRSLAVPTSGSGSPSPGAHAAGTPTDSWLTSPATCWPAIPASHSASAWATSLRTSG